MLIMPFLKYYLSLIVLTVGVSSELCPKQCDCDTKNGLNRAECVNQNIINIDIGVPRIVQVYSLSHNVISELDNYCFKEAGYKSIEILNLSYNLIFWIGLYAFAGLDKLMHLDLSNNRLRDVPYLFVNATPLLHTLDLSSNVFEDLKNEPFLMHDKLQILNLNNCRVKSLPNRLFTRLPNLRKLDLSENYMVTISTEVLRPLRRLIRLELRNDYWHCTPDFLAVETWILSKGIAYSRQCRKTTSKMSEKIIAVVTERAEVEIENVWNMTVGNETLPSLRKEKSLTPFEKFDKEFSSVQALIIGVEIGLAIGILCTYLWLRSACSCDQVSCARPKTRRQRRRNQRVAESELRSNLLWNAITNPDLDTPPVYRREVPLPNGESPPFPTYGLPGIREVGLQVDAIRMPENRPETPPPPYNEYRINI